MYVRIDLLDRNMWSVWFFCLSWYLLQWYSFLIFNILLFIIFVPLLLFLFFLTSVVFFFFLEKYSSSGFYRISIGQLFQNFSVTWQQNDVIRSDIIRWARVIYRVYQGEWYNNVKKSNKIVSLKPSFLKKKKLWICSVDDCLNTRVFDRFSSSIF